MTTDRNDATHGTDAAALADVIDRVVETTLGHARTWHLWDGVPIAAGDRLYTPHKALRRVADHLLDHLAEAHARLSGVDPMLDEWQGSYMTTPADLAPFTRDDCSEAEQRLRRLAGTWRSTLRPLAAELDREYDDGWSIRQIVLHLADSVTYSTSIGQLSP